MLKLCCIFALLSFTLCAEDINIRTDRVTVEVHEKLVTTITITVKPSTEQNELLEAKRKIEERLLMLSYKVEYCCGILTVECPNGYLEPILGNEEKLTAKGIDVKKLKEVFAAQLEEEKLQSEKIQEEAKKGFIHYSDTDYYDVVKGTRVILDKGDAK